MGEVTRILEAVEKGDARAADELLPIVYQELRRLAADRLAQERPGQTLQPTALVHEAYIRLVGAADPGWDSCGHFFAAAAEAMRRILIEHARSKNRLRHGGGRKRLRLDDVVLTGEPADPDNLIALDEALAKLTTVDQVKAELVKLRYFGGLTVDQAARVLGISRATADRYWVFARAWLFHEIAAGEDLMNG